ncbi:MAG: universal stress protein [Deltaproteobacteria bacterium]|nr:universal stress protein [Deltaproteobacteria bacterium]
MYKKILVPLDGSEVAEKILGQVVDLARLTGAEIVLLRVALARTFPGADPTDKQVEVVDRAEKYLAGVKEKLEKEGLKVSAHVLLEHAQEVDLVAMSTHGRTGLGRWALGSVAERVLRHSPKPVLLVRAG